MRHIQHIPILLMLNLFLFSNVSYAGQAITPEHNNEHLTISINPLKNELILYINGEPFKMYPIALGKPETPTPVGDWQVINKYKNWGSGFGTRWIGLDVPWGTFGIHGTNRPHSIGMDASHGCIRMLNKHVEELYELIKVGTRVSIIGHAMGEPHLEPRRLAKGDIGAEVQLIQCRLRSAGFYEGPCNGRFNTLTEQAVKSFEKAHDLPVDGVIGLKEYIYLGLIE